MGGQMKEILVTIDQLVLDGDSGVRDERQFAAEIESELSRLAADATRADSLDRDRGVTANQGNRVTASPAAQRAAMAIHREISRIGSRGDR